MLVEIPPKIVYLYGISQRENTAMLYEKFPDDAHLSKTACLQATKNKSLRLADRNYATWRVAGRKGYAHISRPPGIAGGSY